LVKLAPGLDQSASILVSAPDNNGLEIRGLLIGGMPPLTISVLDPGKVTIRYHDQNIAFISGSEVAFIEHDNFAVKTHGIWKELYGKNDDNYMAWDDNRVIAVKEILRQMRRLGHGGTLILLPRAQKKYSNFSDAGYKIESLYNEGQVITAASNMSLPDGRFVEFARLVANMTALDGATVLTKKLDLVSFGTKLKGSKSPKRIMKTLPVDVDGSYSFPKLEKLGNMRHQSAAKFVASQPSAVAFVVSQDGQISGMQQQADYLVVSSRLELTLF
jgi:hypothetical protein